MNEDGAAGALYVGLMSGTSADGIDAALCRFSPQPVVLTALTHAWPDAVRRRILELGQSQSAIDLDAFGRLDGELAECFAAAVATLLAKAGVRADAIRAVGSHGQTVRHRPRGPHAFTMQLGDPWTLAERCGIDVVADFRRADMAAGGQGAPLMPAFHAALLANQGHARAIVNLGGIANLTVLDADGSVRGFDTGPANALLDAWCLRVTGESFDRDGTLASCGHVDAPLLTQWLGDEYFSRAPPKSTGREHFHLAWLDAHPRVATLAPADVQATLVALTVRTVCAAIVEHAAEARDVLICGGGVHNQQLMAELTTALAPRRVRSTAALGMDPDYIEAMGFAWLARQRMLGLPGNLPAVTGARGPRLLGSVHPARGHAR